MENDATIVHMRSDPLGESKCRKKAPHFVEFNFLTNRRWQIGFCKWKKKGRWPNVASDLLFFAPRFSYDPPKLSGYFTPFFRLSKTINKTLGKIVKIWGYEHNEQVCQVSWKYSKRLKSSIQSRQRNWTFGNSRFVYTFLHKNKSEQIWLHILPTFPLKFFMRFSQKTSLYP